MRRRALRIGIGAIGAAAVAVATVLSAVALLSAHAEDPPDTAAAANSGAAAVAKPPVTPAVTGAGGAPASNGTSPSDAEQPTAPTKTPRTTVRIVFKVNPPNNAMVNWGKKRLGIIKPKAPLIIERPRDSGPMDVVVRVDGYIPVHTRAYTFTDSTVAVKVTPLDKKNTVYGYREVLPPDVDGGVPLPGSASVPDGGI